MTSDFTSSGLTTEDTELVHSEKKYDNEKSAAFSRRITEQSAPAPAERTV